MKLSINLINNDREYIANCPELDINCYGATKIEAMGRIKKVIYFYIESARELGIAVDNLESIRELEKEQINSGNVFSGINLSVN